jgi:hypothetical protein
MPVVMARIRITIECEESHKRAFLAAANLAGLSPQQLFEKLVEENCADDLERAKKAIEGEQKKPKK